MAVATGATGSSSGGDPVLDEAISEMESEGTFETTVDPGTDSGASQAEDTSGATQSDPTPATGDVGSVEDDQSKQVAETGTEVPPQGDAGAQTSDDPLRGTEPFTYSVNGETKTLEGVFRVPGEGLLVPEDKVSAIEQLAERADNLDRVNRDFESQNAVYERLSEWRTQGQNGEEQVLKGRAGLEHMRVQLGTLGASLAVVRSIFEPDAQGAYPKLESLVSVNDAGQIVLNPTAWNHIVTEADNAELRTAQLIRDHLRTLVDSPRQTSPEADVSSWAPKVIDAAVKSSGVDAKALTAKDRTFLSSLLPRYLRESTAEDRKANPSLKPGSRVVDASFVQVVRDRAEIRKEAQAQAVTAEKAGRFNAGQEKGRVAPTKTTVKLKAPPASEQSTTRKKADWDTPLTEALADIGIS